MSSFKYKDSDISYKRKVIFNNSNKKTLIKKGNRRIHSVRHCAVCGKELVHWNSQTNTYICVEPHIDCSNELFNVYLCLKPRSCKNQIERKSS